MRGTGEQIYPDEESQVKLPWGCDSENGPYGGEEQSWSCRTATFLHKQREPGKLWISLRNEGQPWEKRTCIRKDTPPCLHASTHQSHVTHPISFEKLNGIIDTFLHVCWQLRHMFCVHLILVRLTGAKIPTVTQCLFTWELACCWPLWQLLVGRVEGRARGQRAQLQSSWDSNAQLALTAI